MSAETAEKTKVKSKYNDWLPKIGYPVWHHQTETITADGIIKIEGFIFQGEPYDWHLWKNKPLYSTKEAAGEAAKHIVDPFTFVPVSKGK